MIFLERRPGSMLAPFVRTLWHARDASVVGSRKRQRVLPNGRMQLILNLAERGLTDCSGDEDGGQAPSLIVGLQTRAQSIAEADLENLIGVVFHPGGFTGLFPAGARDFSERETCLEQASGAWACVVRDCVREAAGPAAMFDVLETMLVRRIQGARSSVVDFALRGIHHRLAIGEITRQTGLSPRRLGEQFRHHVGTTLKTYARIQRFQEALVQMHAGVDVRWAELALECGYYDQSHFANEFREFSGISPTSYTSFRRPWSNHLAG